MTAFRIYKRIRELLDVSIATPSDGQVLTYDSGGWVNADVVTGASGAAGGVLAGTYPDPSFAADMATQAELDALSAVYQPLDSDLAAIAALTTTTFGRSLLALSDAAAGRTALGLGTAATSAASSFEVAGAAAAAQAASQPVDSDLTAIAALTTTTFGRSLLALADAAAGRTTLGLGTLATQDGTFSGTSSGTNTGDQTTVSGNAGTATALATARAIDGQNFDGTAAITVIAPGTHAATSKGTPVDADEVPLVDSAASNVLKKVTWANVKATIKAYTDTLYPAGSGTSSGTNTGDQTTVSGNAGTATKLATARNIDGQAFDGSAAITVIAPGTHAATGKTTPVDADELALVDSAASNVLKKLTWANVKATIKTYTDTLYPSGSGTSTGTNTGDQTLPTDATLTTSDVTTNNATTSKHGFLQKLDANPAHLMAGDGTWAKLPSYARQPRHDKLVAWNFDKDIITGNQSGTTLVPYLCKVWVPETMTFTNIVAVSNSTGSGLVSGSNRLGVYNSSGTLLSQSADITSWTAATGMTVALGSAQPITGGDGIYVWIAVLVSASVMPTFAGLPRNTPFNLGLVAADGFRFGVLAAVTSGNGLPSSFTPSSGLTALSSAGGSIAPWVGAN